MSPAVATADAAGLADDEIVLGVVLGGRARAYRLRALGERTHHVVNDSVGGVPVAVTYCDITDCVRAYTSPPGSVATVRLAGLEDGEMVVEVGGVEYLQRSGAPRHGDAPALPLETLDPSRTTWKEWKSLHPDTDVFIGPTPGTAPDRSAPDGVRPG
jgi:hypothetical protein